MDKPIISEKFTIDDIHKIREYNYESEKNLTSKDRAIKSNLESDKILESFGIKCLSTFDYNKSTKKVS